MIDLSKTHRDLLATIGATAGSAATAPLAVTDPRCLTEDKAFFRLVGSTRDDLFPLLEVVLTQRFSQLPRVTLIRDLLGPLKNGLGNAHKHGNQRNPRKRIVVDGHLTPHGACIAITDEGPGFDVQATLDRFHEDDHYYSNYGVGFQNFFRTASLLSYADAGRTLLLCFKPEGPGGLVLPHLDSPHAKGPSERLPDEWKPTLRRILEEDRGRALESNDHMAIYGPRPQDPGGYRCVLTTAEGHFAAIYTLQVFSSLEAARTDYMAAQVLYASITRRKIRVPRPVALLEEPPLVVYDFAPSMNLWTYLADRGNPQAIKKMSLRLGNVLGKHHGAPLQVPEETWADTVKRWARALERAHALLLPLDPKAAAKLQTLQETLLRRAARARQENRTTTVSENQEGSFDTVVHGSLGWDCIHYGVNGRFYLSRFRHCRRGHPALDLGGFLADLLVYCDSTGETETYAIGEMALLEGYDEERNLAWTTELPLFIASTLVERIATLTSWKTLEVEPGSIPGWISHLDASRLVTLCSHILEGEPPQGTDRVDASIQK